MSSESIEKGALWASSVQKELETANFGVLVLTQDNLKSPWLHFEAGAIAKQVGTATRVAPLLFGLKPSDIHPPLSQFQVTTFEADDMFKLMQSINVAQSSGASSGVREETLKRAFKGLWPTLQQSVHPKLDGAKTSGAKVPSKIDEGQLLQEVLVNSRELLKTASVRDREIFLEMREMFERAMSRAPRSDRTGFELDVLWRLWRTIRTDLSLSQSHPMISEFTERLEWLYRREAVTIGRGPRRGPPRLEDGTYKLPGAVVEEAKKSTLAEKNDLPEPEKAK